VITRSELMKLFLQPELKTTYVNLKSLSHNEMNSAILARNSATTKSIEKMNAGESVKLQGSAPYKTMENVVEFLKSRGLFPELRGYGAELGCGSALFSIALLSQDVSEEIGGILAVEATPAFVESGIQLAVESFLPNKKEKILSCLGDFESLALEAGSLDFVIQFEAFHHAEELLAVHKEVARLLSDSGIVISVDRAWPDFVPRGVLEELLDHQYPRKWLEAKGFPSNVPFTRRMNGEHEIQDSDWEESIKNAGLKLVKRVHMQPKLGWFQILKQAICKLRLGNLFGIKIPRRKGTIQAQLRSLLHLAPPSNAEVIVWSHPRELTVMVLMKCTSPEEMR
jgi:SAM-dependent methyltransferase